MKKNYCMRTVAGIFAIAIIASSVPTAPFAPLLNSISVTASAAASEIDSFSALQTAINEAEDGDTITLTQNLISDITTQLLVENVIKSLTIDLNGFTLSGGYIFLSRSGLVLTICDSSETQSGKIGNNQNQCGIYVSNGTLTLEGGTIANNEIGIVIEPKGTFNMNGGTITGNTADYGAGVNNRGGVMTMTGGTITGNTANTNGGAVENRGTLTMTGGTITGNTANKYGGGVFNYGTLTMSGGTISDNTAGYGGGVYNDNGTLTMSGGTISENNANEYGGGVYITNSGTLTMSDGTISENTAGYGGGVYHNNGTLTMTGGTISENTANIHGGGVFNYGTLTMSGGTISDNTAGYGGGVYNNRTLTMSGGTITDNTANKYGGGVFETTGGTFEIGGSSVIRGNQSKGDDGVDESNIHLQFSNNKQAKITISETTPLTNDALIGITVYVSNWDENADLSPYIEGITEDNCKKLFINNATSSNSNFGVVYQIESDGNGGFTNILPDNKIQSSDLIWKIDSDGVMTISGDDASFPDSASDDEWCSQWADVKKVVFNTPNLTYLGSYAFHNFDQLEEITLPDTLTSIGKGAFRNCFALTELNIPTDVKEIPEELLNMEYARVEKGEVSSLKKVTMAEDVTSIGAHAFDNCEKMESLTPLTDLVTFIGDGAFSSCKALQSFYMPKALNQDSIGDYTFCSFGLESNTKPLENVTIPDGIKTISDYAFGWTPIQNLTIPASVQRIGSQAFVEWNDLKTVILYGDAVKEIASDTWQGNDNTIFYVPFELVDAYKAAPNWSDRADYIKGIAVTFSMNNMDTDMGTSFEAGIDEDSKVAEPSEPKYTGSTGSYKFGGWYTTPECMDDTEFDFDSTVQMGTILYAKWIEQSVINFNMMSHGVAIPSQTIDFGETFTEPTAPTADGYVFGGWYANSSCTGSPYDFSTPAEKASTTLYAKWTEEYTVSFDLGEYGISIPSVAVPQGESITLPTPSPLSEYASDVLFDGWYTDSNYTDWGRVNSDTYSPYKNITLYAKWKVKVTVSFVAVGTTGLTIDPITLYSGDTFVDPNVPTPDGYVFAGWYVDENCFEEFTTTNTISSDRTLYGKWCPTSGKFSDDLEWSYDETTKELKVFGTGSVIDDVTASTGSVTPNDLYAYYGLPIESINFEDAPNLKVIGAYAFCSLYNLMCVDLPDSVEEIGEYAFAGSLSLVDIRIPESVTSIETFAFGSCWWLNTITFEGSTVPEIASNAFDSSDELQKVFVPEDAIAAYKSKLPSSLADLIDTQSVFAKGFSVSYDGDVTIRFHISIEDDTMKNGNLVLSDSTMIPFSENNYDAATDSYLFSISIPAKNMFDEIQVMYRDQEGTPCTGVITFKMTEHMDEVKNRDAKYTDFVDSLLEYGKQAANYFGTNTSLGAKTYTASEYNAILAALKASGYDSVSMDEHFVGATLLLKTTPILRLYYDEDFTGSSQNMNNPDLYYTEQQISPSQFDKTLNGYSIYNYIYKAISSNNAKLKSVCAALYEMSEELKALI